jgi:hypothetical protein
LEIKNIDKKNLIDLFLKKIKIKLLIIMKKRNQKNKIKLIYNYLIIMNKKKLKWRLIKIYMLRALV